MKTESLVFRVKYSSNGNFFTPWSTSLDNFVYRKVDQNFGKSISVKPNVSPLYHLSHNNEVKGASTNYMISEKMLDEMLRTKDEKF